MNPTALLFTVLTTAAAFAADKPATLSMTEARALVLRRHPRISAADLNWHAAGELVRQARSAYLPQVQALGGGVITSESDGGVNIDTSALQMPGVNDRASAGFSVSQLITDFGRTTHLTASSRLRAGAAEQNTHTTRAQILLETDAACLRILQARAVLEVAGQTVATRRVLRDNTASLQKNELKSSLDVSFAEVNLKDAELLLARSRNDLKSAQATLARLLLDPEGSEYVVSEPAQPSALPAKAEGLLRKAAAQRPELAGLRLELEAAQRFAQAEAALGRPRLSLQGSAGVIPYHDDNLGRNYAAAGVILSWPIFTGGMNSARRKEAELRAQAAGQTLKDEEARIAQDVQIAWLNASNALERLAITSDLRAQAGQSYALAEARYQAGSSGIVELSQAQLNLTAAEINQTTTRYEYLLHRAILDFQTGALAGAADQGRNAGK
ncbi:MAG: Outer membrane protein TolC [Prosthecobacter sp.]|nr:Outer membrane protein TolC [Prosthecobacter sp.]